MSNKSTDDNGAGTSEDAVDIRNRESDAAFEEIASTLTVEAPPGNRRTSIASIAAFLLALIALAGVGWLYITRPGAPEPFVQDNTAVNAVAESVRRLQSSLNEFAGEADSARAAAANASRRLDTLEDRLRFDPAVVESLPGRVDAVENTLAGLQGISAGVRDTWLLAEAEYFMQIANAQAQLAGNPHLARLALLQSDERLAQLGNPALTNVRRVIAGELRALELSVRTDVEGATLTLASLANVVAALPLRHQMPDSAVDRAPGEELSGLDRALASLSSTMSSIVSVRRVEEEVRPFLAPDAAYFLRANLALQLQVARLALLRSELTVFRESLNDASMWLNEYYDTESAQVQSALATLEEVRDGAVESNLPDISESLRLLRQFSLLNESGETVEPGDSGDEPTS